MAFERQVEDVCSLCLKSVHACFCIDAAFTQEQRVSRGVVVGTFGTGPVMPHCILTGTLNSRQLPGEVEETCEGVSDTSGKYS